jgi:hypothetical protein
MLPLIVTGTRDTGASPVFALSASGRQPEVTVIGAPSDSPQGMLATRGEIVNVNNCK